MRKVIRFVLAIFWVFIGVSLLARWFLKDASSSTQEIH